MTHDLPSVPVLSDVTAEQFRAEIFPAAHPVILKNAFAKWPAIEAAKRSDAAAVEYVAAFDRGEPVETIFGDPSIRGRFFYSDDLKGLNFSRRPAPIKESLHRILQSRDDKTLGTTYIQSVPTPGTLPGFAEASPMPFAPPGTEPRIWLGNELTVQTHFDLSHNVAVVVAGRRRFTLFPPEQLRNLYVGPFELTLAGPPVSMVRLDAPDHEKFPRFREALAHGVVAELEPGDGLYIPYFWWHHVQSLESFNILVNYWWNETSGLGSPFDCMLHALLTVRDLPAPMRRAWQAMFEHYVFEQDGPPVDHLPPHARGALGPLPPAKRGQLWATLAGAVQRTAETIVRGLGRPPPRR